MVHRMIQENFENYKSDNLSFFFIETDFLDVHKNRILN